MHLGNPKYSPSLCVVNLIISAKYKVAYLQVMGIRTYRKNGGGEEGS